MTIRTQQLRDGAANLKAALDVLIGNGLSAGHVAQGLNDPHPVIWIDTPAGDHPIRRESAIQTLRPTGPSGRRDVVHVALVHDCRVKWVEQQAERPKRPRVTAIFGREA